MKKNLKVALIVSFSLILLGCAVFSFAMMKLNWDFSELSTAKYETNEYEINKDYKHIMIEADMSDVELILTDSDATKVVCFDNEKVKYDVNVRGNDTGNTLDIRFNDERNWYEHIGFLCQQTKITVYIPQNEYFDVAIKTNTGDITIPADLKFNYIEIMTDTGNVKNYAFGEELIFTTSTGDITVENVSAIDIDLRTSTGKIMMNDVVCERKITLSTSTGENILSNVKCEKLVSEGSTGDITLNSVIAYDDITIKRSTGDVTLVSSDANEDILIQTTTGDVSCSLLVDKIFSTKTNTGKIVLPDSWQIGGNCVVITDTGDIIIEVLN